MKRRQHKIRRAKLGGVRSYFALFLGNLAVPLASFLTGPLLARGLGVADRGILGGLLALVIVAPTLVSFGLQDSTIVVSHQFANHSKVLRRSLLLSLALGGLGAVCISGLALIIHQNLTAAIIFAIASYVLLWVVSIPFRAMLISEGKYFWVVLEKWIQAFARLVVIGALFIADALTVESALIAHVSCSLFGSLLLIGPAVLLVRKSQNVSNPAAKDTIRTLLRTGGGIWIGAIASVLMLRLDQLWMPALTSPHELGLYSVAVSIVEVGLILSASARLVLLPKFLRSANSASIIRFVLPFVLATAAATLLAYFFLPSAVSLLFGSEFEAAGRIGTILVPAIMAAMWLDIVATASTSLGQQRKHAGIMWLGVLMAVILIPFIIPVMGGAGAAWITFASYGVTATLATIRLASSQRRAIDATFPNSPVSGLKGNKIESKSTT